MRRPIIAGLGLHASPRAAFLEYAIVPVTAPAPAISSDRQGGALRSTRPNFRNSVRILGDSFLREIVAGPHTPINSLA